MLPRFPWVRHLAEDERRQFLQELAYVADVPAELYRVIVEWRATAQILADRALTAQLTRPFPDEDHGEAFVP